MAEPAPCERRALSALSPSHLNCRTSTSNKRKYVDDDGRDSYFQAFIATPLPEAEDRSTFTLVPIIELDRSQFRLSYLDFSAAKASLCSGRPFHADIPMFNNDTPTLDSKLLLARLAPNGGLYIIEKARNGVFVACRLRSWIKEDTFSTAGMNDRMYNVLENLGSQKVQSSALVPARPGTNLAGPCITTKPSPKRPKNKKGVLARMSILPKTEPPEPPVQQEEPMPEQKEHDTVGKCIVAEEAQEQISHNSCPGAESVRAEASEPQDMSAATGRTPQLEPGSGSSPSSDDLMETVREILLKTLYTSKTALAHFTKSTLARTRAAFRSSNVTCVSDLAGFYRSRLIGSKKMDLKYRDTLPKIVEASVLQTSPNKVETDKTSTIVKKQQKRRKRLGKDGLYAGEEELVRMCWLSRDDSKTEITSSSLQEQEIKNFLADLRIRETQLQIILILEILTLESATEGAAGGRQPAVTVKLEPNDDLSGNTLTTTPVKASKKRDLKPDLDILADRLCIYQSVSINHPAALDEGKNQNPDSVQKVSDKLRDFCCHVIIPYYFHKVPELVKEISRKLGGPDISPKRPSVSSKTISSRPTKSGTASDTRRRSIPRRTLERVLSEEQSSRQSSPPTLMRSATAPLSEHCNRDSAEPSQRPCSRGSLQKSHSFSNREVDLATTVRVQEAKRKKLANLAKQKEDLTAAIHALKRPNRSLVGMQIMAEAESRSAKRETARRSVLGRNSSNHILGVQITATPKKGEPLGNATSTALMAQPWHEETSILSSSRRNGDSCPSQGNGELRNTPTAARPSTYSAVHETPSRGSSKISNPLSLTTAMSTLQHPPSPPLALLLPPGPSLSLIQATPSTNRIRPDIVNLPTIDNTPLRLTMTKSQRPVLFTPLKETDVSVETAFRDAPLVTEQAEKAMERVMNRDGGGGGEQASMSIYESLGWDDDELGLL